MSAPDNPLPLKRFQEKFARALAEPGGALPGLFAGDETLPFAVYRNNSWAGWQEMLKASFPVITRILGETAMAEVAKQFCQQKPPKQEVPLAFGEGFADFLAASPLADTMPWLADLARLEKTRLNAMQAGDVPRLHAKTLQETSDFATLTLALHPSVNLLTLQWPVDELWQAHQQEEVPEIEIAPRRCELLILRRVQGDIIQHQLQKGGITLLNALNQRKTLTEALEQSLAENSDFDFSAAMTLFFSVGVFVSVGQERDNKTTISKGNAHE